VNVEILRQLDQGGALRRLIAATATFAFSAGLWDLARSSGHGLLLARSIMLPNRREIDPPDQFLARLRRGKSTYPSRSDFLNHL
jgi:hypothetical protein